ncbi:MAG: hypothetical protein LBV69_05520 [Bacteroidales bacterium]|jgi:hypothetical protein|nr:hypothetical protein [Bacteroidales bacterium]
MLINFIGTPNIRDFYLPDALVKKLNLSEFEKIKKVGDYYIIECKVDGIFKEISIKSTPISDSVNDNTFKIKKYLQSDPNNHFFNRNTLLDYKNIETSPIVYYEINNVNKAESLLPETFNLLDIFKNFGKYASILHNLHKTNLNLNSFDSIKIDENKNVYISDISTLSVNETDHSDDIKTFCSFLFKSLTGTDLNPNDLPLNPEAIKQVFDDNRNDMFSDDIFLQKDNELINDLSTFVSNELSNLINESLNGNLTSEQIRDEFLVINEYTFKH